VRGRITEKQLPLAEGSFPGIGRFYRDLAVKPATFLQLVWLYEGWLERHPCDTAGLRAAVQRPVG
jgi:hypothetical protein